MCTRIDHHAKIIVAQEINNQIVNDTTGLVEHAAVQCLAAVLEPVHIIRQQVAQKFTGAVTGQINNRHVRYIKHACIGTHLVMLFYLRTVVNRHVPAGKINQLAAIGYMLVIEGSFVGHIILNPVSIQRCRIFIPNK